MEDASAARNEPTRSSGQNPASKPVVRQRLRPVTVIGGFVVAGFAANLLLANLSDEPYFPDETALLGQSYYFELYRGAAVPGGGSAWNHVDWIRYPAYDHPPLVKYLAALSLMTGGEPIAQDTSSMTAWYDGDWSKPQASTLYWLRLPIVACGVLACLMVYLIGVQIHGRFVGVIAACLVAVNPLFYTLSRRALFDIPAEAFVLATVALTLGVSPKLLTRRVHPRAWAWFIAGGGLFAALAILSKLNGAVALVFLPAWLIGGIAAGTVLPKLFHRTGPSKQAETTTGGSKAQDVSGARIGAANLVLAPIAVCGVGAVALSIMLALNPFFTSVPPLGKLPSGDYEARRIRDLGPLSRFAFLFEFRMKWSQAALADPEWKRYWLPDIPTRIRAVFWQGFGRYSPFGKRRANWHAGMRDPVTGEELEHLLPRTWPAVGWFPLCLIGFLWLLRDGGAALAAGGTPIQWGAALYMAAAVSAVTLTVPLAWDRYFLPLVPAGTLAAIYGVVRCLGWLGSRFVLEPPTSDE